ncbi:MAG TPA: flagellar biosynthesis anti-sigma factor FlgM [Phycisphaerae bacterium]|jgi:negative regulator of flagellin synthesis FlgM|nr:flagellar biosynthesis anti-sigma factor FlgM [Phycisphaerae bacterium]
MSISPIGSNTPITRLQGSKATSEIQGSQDADTGSASDTVEISDVARYLNELKKLPDVREAKVNDARQAIANGTFESPQRIDGTVDRLMAELT